MPYTYEHPRPALTVDVVVLAPRGDELEALLIQRGQPPFEGQWALPGGFVEVDETLDAAARRELHEETGLAGVPVEQLHAFGAVDRDPRERVVSIAYYALVDRQDHSGAREQRRAQRRVVPGERPARAGVRPRPDPRDGARAHARGVSVKADLNRRERRAQRRRWLRSARRSVPGGGEGGAVERWLGRHCNRDSSKRLIPTAISSPFPPLPPVPQP